MGGETLKKRALIVAALVLAMGKRAAVRQLMSLVEGDDSQHDRNKKYGRNKN
jgi:hypothetical protein